MSSAAAVAADGEDGAKMKDPPTPTNLPACSVCMEPWTCSGNHRICCLPCGHVYGRSCLERWLCRCGNRSAKCPQCGEQYEDKLITNLYVPENPWASCYHLQEVRAYHMSQVEEIMKKTMSHNAKVAADIESLRTEHAEFKTVSMELTSCYREKVQMLTEQFAQLERKSNEQISRANAELILMKGQMKKMAEEGKATPADLIEFVEQNCPTLALIKNPLAPAPTDVKKKRQRRHDPLPPVPEEGGPADAVKTRRRNRPT